METAMNEPLNKHADQLEFLRAFVSENASIDYDVLKYGNDAWAIHGRFPYDGETPLAVFETFAEAKQALDDICGPWRPLRDVEM